MPAGRPSIYTPELASAICERIASGESLRAICRTEGWPDRSTVLDWLARHPAFAGQYARARELQADHYADEILEISDDGSNDWMERQAADGSSVTIPDHEHIQRSRLRVDSRKWIASKLAPRKYGDRLAADVSVRTAPADELTDADLAAIAAGVGRTTAEE